MGTYELNCCCGEPLPAECPDCCLSVPDSFKVTITGLSNVDCDACTSLNGADIVLDYKNTCEWEFHDPNFCTADNCDDDPYELTFNLLLLYDVVYDTCTLLLTFRLRTTCVEYEYEINAAYEKTISDGDCAGPHTLTDALAPYGGTACGTVPATVVLTGL